MSQSVHAPKIAHSAIDCQGEIAAHAYRSRCPRGDDVHMLTNIDIGRAIDHLMVDRGYNQKQLAERAGEMDTANLNRIIKGKQAATTDRLEAIAKALDVKVWEIYRLAEDGQPPKEGDPRKAALHELIDTIDPALLDSVFRRWRDDPEKSPADTRPTRHRRRA